MIFDQTVFKLIIGPVSHILNEYLYLLFIYYIYIFINFFFFLLVYSPATSVISYCRGYDCNGWQGRKVDMFGTVGQQSVCQYGPGWWSPIRKPVTATVAYSKFSCMIDFSHSAESSHTFINIILCNICTYIIIYCVSVRIISSQAVTIHPPLHQKHCILYSL